MTWRAPLRLLYRAGRKLTGSLGLHQGPEGRSYPHWSGKALSSPSSTGALEAEIGRLAALSSCWAGVHAVHIETGRAAGYNAGVRFPMASIAKIPLAAVLLAQAGSSAPDLHSLVEVKAANLRAGSGLLQMMFTQPRIQLSVLSLLELAITGSDNSASDILLTLAGGTERVNAWLKLSGIEDIYLHRPIVEMIRDFDVSPERFASDRRDTVTAAAFTSFLAKIQRGELLSPANTEILIQAMRRCQTGPERIPGMLPLRTEVGHKTGTMGSVVNDTGFITLPDQSHVALSIFTIQTSTAENGQDRVIAEIARAVFDYFLFTA